MKTLTNIWFVFILLFQFSCTNEYVKPEDLTNKNEITILKSNNSPFSGTCRKFNNNNKIEFEKNYKNGKLDGKFTRYFDNGNVSNEAYFTDGKPTSYKQFYKSNILRAEKTDNGKIQVLTTWFENGNKKSEQYYYNNLLDGKLEQWYENGKLELTSFFKLNKQHGKCTIYYKNGKIKITGKYVNGELDGIWNTFYENEQLLSKENYNLGKKTDKWTYYFENGNIKAEIIYKNGLVKENKEWNDKGKLINSFSAD